MSYSKRNLVHLLTHVFLYQTTASHDPRRYDERPAGPVGISDDDDDPFEAPFYPFDDDGPQPNGRPFKG